MQPVHVATSWTLAMRAHKTILKQQLENVVDYLSLA